MGISLLIRPNKKTERVLVSLTGIKASVNSSQGRLCSPVTGLLALMLNIKGSEVGRPLSCNLATFTDTEIKLLYALVNRKQEHSGKRKV